jgi:IclR family acetate operon transcriptional repressor
VLSVERAFVILRYLAETPGGGGIREIARKFGYGVNATQKTLNALRVHGVVSQSADDARYSLGFGVVEIAMAKLAQVDARAAAHPHIRSLADRIHASVYLAILDDTDVVYVDRVEPPNQLRIAADLGTRRPLNCTAAGKVLLAFLEDPPLEAWARAGVFRSATPCSIADPHRLRAELETVRQKGYAVDREEFTLGIACVAAPVFNHARQIEAAITTTHLLAALTPERFPEVVQHVTSTAAEISRALGFRSDGRGP